MLILDANILIYAYNKSSDKHKLIRPWLVQILNGNELVGIPWISINAFLRITTHNKIVPKPLSYKNATKIISSILELESVIAPQETNNHWKTFSSLIKSSQAKGNLIPDAHLASIAIDLGATLCTCDTDFKKFDGLKLKLFHNTTVS